MELDLLEKNAENTGPYYNVKQAAEYCGYSPDHFRHLASEHQVPRCGPNQNRYAQSILNTFMSSPKRFKIKTFSTRRSFKKLEV